MSATDPIFDAAKFYERERVVLIAQGLTDEGAIDAELKRRWLQIANIKSASADASEIKRLKDELATATSYAKI